MRDWKESTFGQRVGLPQLNTIKNLEAENNSLIDRLLEIQKKYKPINLEERMQEVQKYKINSSKYLRPFKQLVSPTASERSSESRLPKLRADSNEWTDLMLDRKPVRLGKLSQDEERKL